MCGRGVQTTHAIRICAQDLQVQFPTNSNNYDHANTGDGPAATVSHIPQEEQGDNYNMSPGMDAWIIYHQNYSPNTHDRDTVTTNKSTANVMARHKWGLVPQGGSARNPITTGNMSIHFSNLMFNARSDTLYQKQTFSRLAREGKTCLVALDGFFEWKQDKLAIGKHNKKQPYYVKAQEKEYLLMAGLWTCVSRDGNPDNALPTFTIITTEACQPLQWLHTRMPLCIWDNELTHKWLEQPSEDLLHRMVQAAMDTSEGRWQHYAVTKDMSSVKFRNQDSIKPLPKPKTVKSFFTAAAGAKRKLEDDTPSPHITSPMKISQTPKTPPRTTPPSSKKRSITQTKKVKPNSSLAITHWFKSKTP